MKTIRLSNGMDAIVDDQDYPRLSALRWHATRRRRTVYAQIDKIRQGKRYKTRMHQMILTPHSGMVIDHINGNGLDNRRCNLRLVSPAGNAINRRKYRGVSKYMGVAWLPRIRQWQAGTKKGKKFHYLGCFKNEIDAARAYDAAVKRIHGEHAYLNFPTSA